MYVRRYRRFHSILSELFAIGLFALVVASPGLVADTSRLAGDGHSVYDPIAATVAKQQIEYLRRHYARATDLIGKNTPESIATGRAIYQKIFTQDAEITVTNNGEETFRRTGPDEWVDVVIGALGTSFTATQHLIGSQLVDIKSLPAADGSARGEASMTSYLQAWHDSGELVDIFIGTYSDEVRYSPEGGWQIYRMNLDQTAHEVRKR